MAGTGSRTQQGIADLAALSTDELRQRWTELYRAAPVPRISRDLLIRGVAFRIQEDAYGGLSKSHRRQLQRLAEALRDGGSMAAAQGQSFKVGTKLIREWKGKVHEILIGDDGYIWAGKRYGSLSQIACSITGTRWSGPRFFGLESQKQAAASIRPAEGRGHG